MADFVLEFQYQQAVDGIRQIQEALRTVQNQVQNTQTTGANAFDALAQSAATGGAAIQQLPSNIDTLRKSLELLERGLAETLDPRAAAEFNRYIAATRLAIQGIENITGQAKGKMQQLRDTITQLSQSREKAFSTREIEGFNRQIQVAQRELNQLQTAGLKQTGTIGEKAFGKIAAAAAAAASVEVFRRIGENAIKAAADYETATVAFEVLAGSAAAAQRLQQELADFTAKTPFELPDVQAATKSLLAFGFSAKDAVPELQRLGNIAAAVNIPLSDLATIYGKNKLGGFIQAEDLRQLAERGVPVFESLAAQLKVNVDKVKELGSANKITFANLKVAFDELGGAGGRFYGLIDKQSQTLSGRLSTLRDDAREASRAFGEGLNVTLKELTISASAFFKSLDKEKLRTFGESVGNVIVLVVRFGKEIAVLGGSILVLRGIAAGFQLVRNASLAMAASNPVLLALVAGINALYYSYQYLTKETRAAEEAQQRFNATKKEVIDLAQQEADSANSLFEIIRDSTASQRDKKAAVDALLAQYPQYLGEIDTEKELLEQLDTAQQRVNKGIIDAAIAQIQANKLREAGNEILEASIKKQKAIGDIIAKRPELGEDFYKDARNLKPNYDENTGLKTFEVSEDASFNSDANKVQLANEEYNNTLSSIRKNAKETKKALEDFAEPLRDIFIKEGMTKRFGELNKQVEILNEQIKNADNEQVKNGLEQKLALVKYELEKERKVALEGGNKVSQSKAEKTKEQLDAEKKALDKRKELEKALEKLRQEAEEAADQAAIAKLEGQEKEIAETELKYDKQVKALRKHITDKENLTELEKQVNIAAGQAIASETEKMNAQVLAIRVKYMKKYIEDNIKLQATFDKERAESDERYLKTQIKQAKEQLDFEEANNTLLIQTDRQLFYNQKRSDEEIKKYEEELDQAKILFDLGIQKKRLENALKFGKDLSDIEKKTIQTQIDTITVEEKNVQAGKGKDGATKKGKKGKENKDGAFSIEGIYTNLVSGDEKKGEALAKLHSEAIKQVNALADAYVTAADKMVAAAEKRVDAAQTALDTEIELAKLGYANNVELKQKELADAKKNQAEAIEEQRKATNIQIALNAVQQGASLAAAAAQIMGQIAGSTAGLGIPIAIGLIAAMFAAFAASKAKAREAASYEAGGDAYIDSQGVMRGPRHSQGGVGIEVEGGEAVIAGKNRVSIVNRKMTEKHLDLISAINADDRVNMAYHLQGLTGGISVNHDIATQMQQAQSKADIYQFHYQANNSRLEQLLQQQIDLKKNQEQISFDQGKKIIRKGNLTRIVK